MSSELLTVGIRVTVFALFFSLICGGEIVAAQEKSSTFYSTYDARELVKDRKYKGIDFAYGDESSEIVSELRDGGSEKTKSISYGCQIRTTGEDAFNLADFLNWLAEATTKQIESGDGTLVRVRHKVGRRFYLDYIQKGFVGRVEVDGDIMGKDQMSLEIEIVESSKK